ncbi:MAG: tetraacyldisaccharide 4'-kinase [Candidatus Omnitrophica bacterium CG11_big_fil_rev_8_21_14_0_20_45_26]|uniref:Tetraacyldisaccharide 4'-kinase n=1 Tax=Candidatus Abzuiibacterium crystallinum TaxID=1974748 RepID=A0A2H0LMQ1_9BACT|nr:MAG: tetraacyldisaccharide 4'-kinase [Candidatus Omnitrophica bacterium CG11_big_fil_rev_8_21_14_0_20_45_26]PIW65172.1 MAG: tetraacyldisaccharide 4'-kinase [Candidatus Omnitrophica bacterium CG12_big_fil_rev_8_21_14_0_65_45_16]
MTIRNYFRLIIENKHGAQAGWFWRPWLWLIRLMYESSVNLRASLYAVGFCRSKKLSIPAVSVGNITWGGVGKTPLTLYLSRFLLKEHKVPLILTRGYNADEVREYQANLAQAVIGVGKNRYEIAKRLLKKQKADIAILDDGFQHWQLHRDLNLVVINALNPFGNGTLIPTGILREPLTSLKRAHMIIFNDVNLIDRKNFETLRDQVKQLVPTAEIIEAQREPIFFYQAKSGGRIDVDRMRGRRVTTFSGVGTPRSFQLVLSKLGIKTIRNFEFSDHHAFTARELKEINEVCESSQSDSIITTEKDFFRRRKLITQIVDPLILRVYVRITVGEEILKDRIRKLFS